MIKNKSQLRKIIKMREASKPFTNTPMTEEVLKSFQLAMRNIVPSNK